MYEAKFATSMKLKLKYILILLLLSIFFLYSSFKVQFVFQSIGGYLLRRVNYPTDFTVYENSLLGVVPYNPESYKYIINNKDICTDKDVSLLILIKTHPNNLKRRNAIRETWGKMSNWKTYNKHKNVLVMFLVGMSSSNTLTEKVQLLKENEKYADIIQDSFTENFYNLTIKLVSQFKWASQYCSSAEYFMTADDDVFVHTKNLVDYLFNDNLIVSKQGLYVGHMRSGSPPYRDTSVKYSVPHRVYKGLYYPDYCPGAGYVLSMDVVKMMYEHSLNLPLLYIDDVYAGMLARLAGVQPTYNRKFLGENTVYKDPCYSQKFITSHNYKPEHMKTAFKYINTQTKETFCLIKSILPFKSYL